MTTSSVATIVAIPQPRARAIGTGRNPHGEQGRPHHKRQYGQVLSHEEPLGEGRREEPGPPCGQGHRVKEEDTDEPHRPIVEQQTGVADRIPEAAM
jgi:hypothetical protein